MYRYGGGSKGNVGAGTIIQLRKARPFIVSVINKETAFFDRETARIDVLIEKIRKSIDLLHEYHTALTTTAVMGKIDVREG